MVAAGRMKEEHQPRELEVTSGSTTCLGKGSFFAMLWPGATEFPEASSPVPSVTESRDIEPPPPPVKKKTVLKPYSFFGVADTDTETEPESPSLLDWRNDPETSLTDWTLIITTPTGKDAQHYHVHRNMMLSSQFFANLFQTELAGGQSEIELPAEAAAIVPDFLDYLYRLRREVTRDNAVPLYYLSRLLGIHRLRWESKQFWTGDLTLETVDFYYEQAIIFQEETLMNELLQTCLKDEVLRGINAHSNIVTIPCPRLWVFLAKSVDRKQSEHLSTVIAAFCELHKEHMDADVFNDLTQPLPEIDIKAVTPLLQLESEIVQPAITTSLQRSCMRAMAFNWDSLDVSSPPFYQMMSSQTPQFLTRAFAKTVLVAQSMNKRGKASEMAPEDSIFLQNMRETSSLVDLAERQENLNDAEEPLYSAPIFSFGDETESPLRELSTHSISGSSCDESKQLEPEGIVSCPSRLTSDDAAKEKSTPTPIKPEAEASDVVGHSSDAEKERTSPAGLEVSVEGATQETSSTTSAMTEPIQDTVEV